MIHARLPPKFYYYALLYAIIIFNIIPVKQVTNKEGFPATPFELFFSTKPRITHLRVFGCPVVFKSELLPTIKEKSPRTTPLKEVSEAYS
jgi:hypothetical protein